MKSELRHRGHMSGHSPGYGAIFMANKWTKEECLGRKLLGLPIASSDFVSKVKKGMLLFLFDYDNRELNGVFKASSKGGLHLVPDAYNKRFPAQVCFDVLWQCTPLPETVFHEAIMENYFAPYKFNFGLSRDQVSKLRFLFEKEKLKILERGLQMHNDASLVGESHPRSVREIKSLQAFNNNNHNPEKNLSQTECEHSQDIFSLTQNDIVPMFGKLASLVVFDPKMILDLNDSLSLALPEVAKSDYPSLHKHDLKPSSCSPGIQNHASSPRRARTQNHDLAVTDYHIDDSIRYQVHGLCFDNSKPDNFFAAPQTKHNLSDVGDCGLHSESREKCLSAFGRLDGWSKVAEQISGSSSENKKVMEKNFGNNSELIKDILNRLDTEHKIWQDKCIDTSVCDGVKASMKISVFSRLGKNVKMAEERSSSTLENIKVIGEKISTSSENIRGIINRLDKEHKIWHDECIDEAHLYGGKASINMSVFSRLGKDVKMAIKSEQKERPDDSFCQSLKRKMDCYVKTLNGGKKKRKNISETQFRCFSRKLCPLQD